MTRIYIGKPSSSDSHFKKAENRKLGDNNDETDGREGYEVADLEGIGRAKPPHGKITYTSPAKKRTVMIGCLIG